MTYTFDEAIVSDLHKDARGYRPRDMFWATWEDADMGGKQVIWDYLIAELNAEMDRQRQAESMAVIALHQRIQGLMLLRAKDEVQALKWIIQAEGFSKFDLMYGADYICFNFDLPYSAKNEFPIQEAINEVLASLEESV